MWEFVLRFQLPEDGRDPAMWLDRLFEAGCDDATVGTGKHGAIALDFSREAPSADEAIRSAIENVQIAIPGAQLIEIQPDLVNLADVADIVGCSRQNIRKYAAGEIKAVKAAFPEPIHAGLWRLTEVLIWFGKNTEIVPPVQVLDLSRVASSRNIEAQRARLSRVVAAE
jgi:hypothetical protein